MLPDQCGSSRLPQAAAVCADTGMWLQPTHSRGWPAVEAIDVGETAKTVMC